MAKEWFGHPRGLSTLFFTELWERFSYYGMRAILILYMVAPAEGGGLGMSVEAAGGLYGLYTGLVYLACLPGGWFADRFIGQAKAVLYGGIVIAIGHFSMAFPGLNFFYFGLGCIVFGTGLLKPNVSAMVGSLYERSDDKRRDSAFSIYYMGINIGGFLAPLVCGTLGQNYNWHWGFAAAGVGMLLGLVQYLWGQKYLKASIDRLQQEKLLERKTSQEQNVSWTRIEIRRMAALTILFVFSILFWAAFEQAGNSLSLFAERFTENSFLGYEFPSTWFQSLNSMFILMFAPLIAALWIKMGSKELSGAAKFTWGLLLVSLGYLVLVFPCLQIESSGGKAGPEWLTILYLLHTLGELCLSPVGLSLCTKLAPARISGFAMGIWFTAISAGTYLGGYVAGFFEKFKLSELFGAVFVTTFVATIVLGFLIKPINKLAEPAS